MRQLLLVLLISFSTSCKSNSQKSDASLKSIQTDTISFKLGSDHGIHLEGSINGSEPLDFLFDTGANAIVLTSSLIGDKVSISLDSQTENNGADGISTMQTR